MYLLWDQIIQFRDQTVPQNWLALGLRAIKIAWVVPTVWKLFFLREKPLGNRIPSYLSISTLPLPHIKDPGLVYVWKPQSSFMPISNYINWLNQRQFRISMVIMGNFWKPQTYFSLNQIGQILSKTLRHYGPGKLLLFPGKAKGVGWLHQLEYWRMDCINIEEILKNLLPVGMDISSDEG